MESITEKIIQMANLYGDQREFYKIDKDFKEFVKFIANDGSVSIEIRNQARIVLDFLQDEEIN